MSDSILQNSLFKPIESLTIDKDELRQLVKFLGEKAVEAAELEHQHLIKNSPAEKSKEIKEDIDKCLPLRISIDGFDGEKLFGTIDEVFESSSFPDRIKLAYINSKLAYDVLFKYTPRNHFEFCIDFFKPKVLDFSLLPSDKTPNNSYFKVEGYDTTWVNGIFAEIDHKLKKRSSSIGVIHKSSIYDLFVWVIGLPFVLSICVKSADWVHKLFKTVPALQTAVFIYLFLLCLILFRVIFHYARWIYPMIEYRNGENRSLRHRVVLGGLVAGIIGNGIYDLIKFIFLTK